LHDPPRGERVTRRSAILVPLTFLLLFALFVAVFLKMSAASRAITDYDAERSMELIAGGVLESLALQESPSGFEHAAGIIAIGLYDGNGNALKDRLFVGRAPERIDVAKVRPPYDVSFVRATKTLVLIRPRRSFPLLPLGNGRAPSMADIRQFSRSAPAAARANDFIYVEADGRNYWRARGLAGAEGVLGIVLFGCLCTWVSILLVRNQRYRDKISRERNLLRLGEAARTLAHEIRNPLASIKVQTELLRAMSPHKESREIRIVEEEVQRLTYLAERTGDFVRDPLGRPVEIDLAEFLSEVAASLGQRVRYCRPDADLPVSVLFDPHRLRIAVENVVRNGLEWSARPGTDPQPPVEVRLRRRQKELLLEVEDRGPGIPRKDRTRVFEPLFTTRSDGWGLGLSIAQRFVEAAQGRIEISSPPRGGTTVTITLSEAPR
jgi:two-component system, NtrC family, sensor histidine kinase HydH